jgi:hypothetical protein
VQGPFGVRRIGSAQGCGADAFDLAQVQIGQDRRIVLGTADGSLPDSVGQVSDDQDDRGRTAAPPQTPQTADLFRLGPGSSVRNGDLQGVGPVRDEYLLREYPGWCP